MRGVCVEGVEGFYSEVWDGVEGGLGGVWIGVLGSYCTREIP